MCVYVCMYVCMRMYICMYVCYVCMYVCVCKYVCTYRVSQEERSIFWEVIVSVILSKNIYMNMYLIPNGFRVTSRGIWIYNRKIVDKKEILFVRIVSNTGIYCSTDRVGRVYNKCSKIQPSTSICTLQLVWRHGVLFVWVRLDVPLCKR